MRSSSFSMLVAPASGRRGEPEQGFDLDGERTLVVVTGGDAPQPVGRGPVVGRCSPGRRGGPNAARQASTESRRCRPSRSRAGAPHLSCSPGRRTEPRWTSGCSAMSRSHHSPALRARSTRRIGRSASFGFREAEGKRTSSSWRLLDLVEHGEQAVVLAMSDELLDRLPAPPQRRPRPGHAAGRRSRRSSRASRSRSATWIRSRDLPSPPGAWISRPAMGRGQALHQPAARPPCRRCRHKEPGRTSPAAGRWARSRAGRTATSSASGRSGDGHAGPRRSHTVVYRLG